MPLPRVVRIALLALTWGCVATVVAAFFLPWAHVRPNPNGLTGVVAQLSHDASFRDLADELEDRVGRVVVTVTQGDQTTTGQLSDLSALPSDVSGKDIPVLARRKDAQLAAAITEVLLGESAGVSPETVRMRSNAVYLVPLVALAAALLLTVSRRRQMIGVVAAVCVAIAGAGGWQLSTAGVDTFLATITVGRGLWLSCAAYAGLGASGLLLALAPTG
jgi:hypothetical protein